METNAVAARIRERLDELGLDPTPTSVRAGLSASAIRNILDGKSKSPRGDTLMRLSIVLKTSVEWLATGKGERYVDHDDSELIEDANGPAGIAEVSGRGRVGAKVQAGFIPEFDLKAGASFGGGVALETYVSDEDGNVYRGEVARAQWCIPTYYLAGHNMHPGRTHILPVDGPSMLPDFQPNDRVLIDLDDTNPGRDGVFAIFDGSTESVIIKNVQVIRGSSPLRIRCVSSNSLYEPFELELDGVTRILGRVRLRVTTV
ncbi:XRE family transcriptional regulator [Salinarimonas sp.]|uniref:XRE family transcriptional regulator n=1 Tax=Salinarimonas sp. TaxID=2766526 RepID=UPI00391A7F4A